MKISSEQNRASHLWFRLLSEGLNDGGLDIRVVMTPEWKIMWTEESVKENLFRPVSKAMYGTDSIAELSSDQLTNVIKVIDKHLLENHAFNMPFPSIDNKDS